MDKMNLDQRTTLHSLSQTGSRSPSTAHSLLLRLCNQLKRHETQVLNGDNGVLDHNGLVAVATQQALYLEEQSY